MPQNRRPALGSSLVRNGSGFQEVGASAPEASGLKSFSQGYLCVGAEAPTSYIANLGLLAKEFVEIGSLPGTPCT